MRPTVDDSNEGRFLCFGHIHLYPRIKRQLSMCSREFSWIILLPTARPMAFQSIGIERRLPFLDLSADRKTKQKEK
jgi:hypothetical protein